MSDPTRDAIVALAGADLGTVERWLADASLEDLERALGEADCHGLRALQRRIFATLALRPGSMYAILSRLGVELCDERDPDWLARALGEVPGQLLAEVVAAGDCDEQARRMLACGLHECALSGQDLRGEPALTRFHAELAEAGDPLGWLPLIASPLEHEAGLVARSALDGDAPPPSVALPAGELPPDLGLTLLDTPELQALPATPWGERVRRGSWMIACFAVRPRAPLCGRLLARVPRPAIHPWAHARQCSPARVLRDLFDLATGRVVEGFHESPRAMGRVHAWRALGMLAGVEADASMAAIAAGAARCAWVANGGVLLARDKPHTVSPFIAAMRPDGILVVAAMPKPGDELAVQASAASAASPEQLRRWVQHAPIEELGVALRSTLDRPHQAHSHTIVDELLARAAVLTWQPLCELADQLPELARHFARHAAHRRSTSELRAALAHAPGGRGSLDLRIRWLHEAVLHGHDLARDRVMRAFHDKHAGEFATLPLAATALERAAAMRVSGESWRPMPPTLGPLPATGDASPSKLRVSRPDELAELCAAFAPAAAYYGDTCAAAVHDIGYGPLDISRQYLGTHEPLVGRDLGYADRFTPAGVLSLLYRTATVDGAGGSAVFASEGRRLAWRSLAALVGLPASAGCDAIEALAARCTWIGCFARRWAASPRASTALTFVAAARPDGILALAALEGGDAP